MSSHILVLALLLPALVLGEGLREKVLRCAGDLEQALQELANEGGDDATLEQVRGGLADELGYDKPYELGVEGNHFNVKKIPTPMQNVMLSLLSTNETPSSDLREQMKNQSYSVTGFNEQLTDAVTKGFVTAVRSPDLGFRNMNLKRTSKGEDAIIAAGDFYRFFFEYGNKLLGKDKDTRPETNYKPEKLGEVQLPLEFIVATLLLNQDRTPDEIEAQLFKWGLNLEQAEFDAVVRRMRIRKWVKVVDKKNLSLTLNGINARKDTYNFYAEDQ